MTKKITSDFVMRISTGMKIDKRGKPSAPKMETRIQNQANKMHTLNQSKVSIATFYKHIDKFVLFDKLVLR